MYQKKYHIHFVGIGGIGMFGLAELLHNQGYRVTGSDLKAGPTVARLRSLGIRVAESHDPRNLQEADVVVVNTCAFIEDAREESVDAILAAVGPATTMVSLVNPNNPTGAVVPREEMLKIAQVAIKHDLLD